MDCRCGRRRRSIEGEGSPGRDHRRATPLGLGPPALRPPHDWSQRPCDAGGRLPLAFARPLLGWQVVAQHLGLNSRGAARFVRSSPLKVIA